MVADIEIAQNTPMRPIVDVAADLGLTRDDLVRKGDYIAKVRVAAVDRARKARQGKLVLVTGSAPRTTSSRRSWTRTSSTATCSTSIRPASCSRGAST